MQQDSDLIDQMLEAVHSHPWLAGGVWHPLDLNPKTLTPIFSDILEPCTALRERESQILTAMQEAYGNVARHAQDSADGMGFVRHNPHEVHTLDFLVADAGSGIPVKGDHPPFPARMIGRSYPFRHTMNGVVFCRVVDPDALEFTLYGKDVDISSVKTEDLPTGGMGMGIMTRTMNRVTYLSHVEDWNFLWLQLQCELDAEGSRPHAGPADRNL